MVWASTLEPIAIDDDTLGEAFERSVARQPDRLALVDGPSGIGVSYRELLRRVERIAAWLRVAGLEPGGCLAVWAPNVPLVAAAMLASLRLGAAVTPLSPAATAAEAARQIEQTGASIVVTVPSLVESAAGLADRVIVLGQAAAGAVPLAEVLATDEQPRRRLAAYR